MKDQQILLVGKMGAQMRGELEGRFPFHQLESLPDPEEFLATRGSEIAGIVMGGTDSAPDALIDRLPNLKVVSCYGVGYDGVNAARCAGRGIMVTHTPGVLSDEVANLAIALLLAVSRKIVAYDRYVRGGRWKRDGNPPLTRGIAGKKVGVVGMGRIGIEIARKLEVFHCDIVYHTRRPKPELAWTHYPDLLGMARDCDVMILITPGGPETRHMVNREVLDALGPEGTLINVARGSVVDEQALVEALAEGRLGAAGLDVFEDEPNVPEALFAMENVVVLPHVASATVETRAAMRKLVADNLEAWLADGKAITPVPECTSLNG